ncbi:MAG TPA: M1 family aminopeptidase [Terriglobia bacterium]|nr:M1 family aminopeptidase [Terriglobia bacterium]
MARAICFLLLFLASQISGGYAAELATAPSEELLRVYAQLRRLGSGAQWAVAENVIWKRDAAAFTFRDGKLVFAAPVEGHVLAAAFVGRGTFALDPPTPTDQRQISRFTKSPRLEDNFREAVFFFTDDSWPELQKLVSVRSEGGDPAVGGKIAAAQERFSENYNDWWSNQRKGNFQMRNLAARMLADLSDPASRGFFLAVFKGERSGDLVFHISWNRDVILLPFYNNDEEVMLLHYNPGDYYEWWSGFHLKEEYAQNPRPEHRTLLARCLRSRIEAEVGKDKKLSAAAEMEAEVPGGPARLLPLNLEGVLRISSVEDGEGKKLAYIQEARDLDNDPWVILPQPAEPGRTYRLKITYQEDSSRDSRIVNQRGPALFYVTARTSWFPSFGAFDDRTQFSLRFRSPKKYTFVGTGRRVRSEKSKEALETEWESDIPLGVAGFNYGEFVEKSHQDDKLTVTAYTGKQIPDELGSIQTELNMAELAGGPEGPRNLAAQYGLMPGGFNTSHMVGYAAGISFQALKLFEYYFGVLPFKTISVTQQPVRGYGQSWPTLIFLPYDSLLDATTRNSLRMQDSAEAREFYNLVAVHEMAHQWWGHVVGWKTYHDQWLSEGLAEFSAALYLKRFEPKKWDSFWDLKRKWLFSNNRAGRRPVDEGPLWLNSQLDSYAEPRNSYFLTYMKGAYVMEMLRMMMEDPRSQEPDTRFIRMMRDFVSTYAGKNASTEDFRRVVEKHMGEPMDWFFNEWVYGMETPQYDFKWNLQDTNDGKTLLRVTLTQSGVSDSFEMRVPLYVQLDGKVQRLGFAKIRGATTSNNEIVLPFHPEKVMLDENRSVLCQVRQ